MPNQASSSLSLPEGVTISGALKPGYERILTSDALEFVARLARRFEPRRRQLMQVRAERQAKLDGGALPDFLPETRKIRDNDWKITGIPDDLLDRRVKITGPTTRKMIINAVNSGAKVFMADFEDANTPTWSNRPASITRLARTLLFSSCVREAGICWRTTSPSMATRSRAHLWISASTSSTTSRQF